VPQPIGRLPGPWPGTAVLLALLAPAAGAGAQQRTVTLAQAIRLAEQVDPEVVNARGQSQVAGANVRQAWGGYLPSLSTTANAGNSFSEGPSRPDPITGQVLSGDVTTSSVSLGASATLTLFDGFRRESALRSARAGDRAALAGLDFQRAQAALRTTGVFLSALQSQALVAVHQDRIRRADEQFKIAVAKLATRAATVADSLQTAAQLGQARLALLVQERQLAEAETQLARVVGMRGRVTAAEDPSLYEPVAVADTAALLAEALAGSPEVLRAEALVDQQRAAVGQARASYLPTVGLSGASSWGGSDRNDYRLFNNRSVTLGLSWPLFNGFQRELQVAQQRAGLETARARAEDLRRDVASRLEAQLVALATAAERVRLSQEILATARATVQVQTERYRIGSIDITVLSQAEQQLAQAEQDAVQARFDYVRARAGIEAIIGRSL
jgi:outer membrane protein